MREYLTYKEWKHNSSLPQAVLFLASEYLTYKEWKLDYRKIQPVLHPSLRVSTLPIRNGNFKSISPKGELTDNVFL